MKQKSSNPLRRYSALILSIALSALLTGSLAVLPGTSFADAGGYRAFLQETVDRNETSQEVFEQSTHDQNSEGQGTVGHEAAGQGTGSWSTAGQGTVEQGTAEQETAEQGTAEQEAAGQETTGQEASEQNADEQDASEQGANEQDTPEQDTSQHDVSEQDASEQSEDALADQEEDPSDLALLEEDEPTGDFFQFEVTVTSSSRNFSIPTSGYLNGSATNKTNSWLVNWGDSSVNQSVSVVQSSLHTGVLHTYASAGSYTITIMPAGSNEAWLSCFGFYAISDGANIGTNKQKITRIMGPITPNMTRTSAQMTSNAPTDEWAYAFYGCENLVQAPHLSGWDSVTTVGNGFLHALFHSCTKLSELPSEFTLPQNLTSVGTTFASNMFTNCTGLTTLPSGFTFPQNLTSVGNSFAYGMFAGCIGLVSLPANFNLPQNLTSVGTGFAIMMFYLAGSATFQINDAFTFPALSATETSKTSVFTQTLLLSSLAPLQNRTAGAIIGTCATPSTARQTFGNGSTISAQWSDQPYISTNWGGLGQTDHFQLEVTVATGDLGFLLPTSGYLNGNFTKQNNWRINWGDGSAIQSTNTFTQTHAGISHTYPRAGSFIITIMPGGTGAGATEAWLSCFGFTNNNTGANIATNKAKVTRVLGPINPVMSRTSVQITGAGPNYEWYNAFYGCTSLTAAPSLNMWDAVTSVGDSFFDQMFYNCSSLTTVPAGFNLPQGITSVGSHFADSLFYNCTSLTSLPATFNLPQGITTVGNSFADSMFCGAGSATFQIPTAFAFPSLSQVESNKDGVFYQTFLLHAQAPLQNREAASIIGSCSTPNQARETFGDGVHASDHWSDQPLIAANWGGLARDSAILIVNLVADEPYQNNSDFMLKITHIETQEVCTKILPLPAQTTTASFAVEVEAGSYRVEATAHGGSWRYSTGSPKTVAMTAGLEQSVTIEPQLISTQWISDTGWVLNIFS